MELLTDANLPLGRVVATRAVMAWSEDHPGAIVFVARCLQRHRRGDWGDVDPEDWQTNNDSYREGLRILSVYPLPNEMVTARALDDRIWIITEWDRSATTVLFPTDY